MNASQLLTAERCEQVIAHVIERNLPVALTHRAADGWHLYKIRSFFASGSRESNRICVNVAVPGDASTSSPPEPGDPVGVTFRLNRRKCVFNSVVRSVTPRQDRLLLTIRWPDELQQIQRRVFERAPVPPDTVIPVRFWRDDGGVAAPPCDRDVRHGQLENLSAGGLQIKVAGCADVHIGSIYKCVFAPRPGAPALILDARLRHRDVAEQDRLVLGLQLIGLETTSEGRRLLDQLVRIVSQFQRASRRPGGIRRTSRAQNPVTHLPQ